MLSGSLYERLMRFNWVRSSSVNVQGGFVFIEALDSTEVFMKHLHQLILIMIFLGFSVVMMILISACSNQPTSNKTATPYTLTFSDTTQPTIRSVTNLPVTKVEITKVITISPIIKPEYILIWSIYPMPRLSKYLGWILIGQIRICL
jgi:hypothetical protein